MQLVMEQGKPRHVMSGTEAVQKALVIVWVSYGSAGRVMKQLPTFHHCVFNTSNEMAASISLFHRLPHTTECVFALQQVCSYVL